MRVLYDRSLTPTPLVRIIYYDLENTAMVARTWTLYPDNISHDDIIADKTVISWSAQVRGHNRVLSDVQTPTEAVNRDDTRIITSLHRLLSTADIIVGHNIDRHDTPILRTRALLHRLSPLPPVRSIDTLKIARRDFKFESNKLDYLARKLLGESKLPTNAQLWRDCEAGDPQALARMHRYNKHDTRIGFKVFEALLPHSARMIKLVEGTMCPYCDSGQAHQRGTYHTNAASYQKWQCQTCQRYYRTLNNGSTRAI